MQILYPKTALNRPPRILRSENGNSALGNGNSVLRKWKTSPMPWKVGFSTIFHAKMGNSVLPRSGRNSILNSMIMETQRDYSSIISLYSNFSHVDFALLDLVMQLSHMKRVYYRTLHFHLATLILKV